MDVQPQGPVSDAERVTRQEARAVIRLWDAHRRERERQASLPTIRDLAEGLDISVEEVCILLSQVRDFLPSRPRPLPPQSNESLPPEVHVEVWLTAMFLAGSMLFVFSSLYN